MAGGEKASPGGGGGGRPPLATAWQYRKKAENMPIQGEEGEDPFSSFLPASASAEVHNRGLGDPE
eukprot:scaffold7594_cov111-Isochrysis_galbana.AAC.8